MHTGTPSMTILETPPESPDMVPVPLPATASSDRSLTNPFSSRSLTFELRGLGEHLTGRRTSGVPPARSWQNASWRVHLVEEFKRRKTETEDPYRDITGLNPKSTDEIKDGGHVHDPLMAEMIHNLQLLVRRHRCRVVALSLAFGLSLLLLFGLITGVVVNSNEDTYDCANAEVVVSNPRDLAMYLSHKCAKTADIVFYNLVDNMTVPQLATVSGSISVICCAGVLIAMPNLANATTVRVLYADTNSPTAYPCNRSSDLRLDLDMPALASVKQITVIDSNISTLYMPSLQSVSILSLQWSDVQNITLPALTQIERFTAAQTRLGEVRMPAVTTMGDMSLLEINEVPTESLNITAIRDTAMDSISLPGLSNLNVTMDALTYISVLNLDTVVGGWQVTMPALQTVQTMMVQGCVELAPVYKGRPRIDMPSLTAINYLTILTSWNLGTVEFPSLTSFQTLTVIGNVLLPRLRLPQLQTISSSMTLKANRDLEGLEMPNLKWAKDISVDSHDVLVDVQLANMTFCDSLAFRANSMIRNLSFTALESASLAVVSNVRLVELGLGRLKNTTTMVVADNDNMQELLLPSLTVSVRGVNSPNMLYAMGSYSRRFLNSTHILTSLVVVGHNYMLQTLSMPRFVSSEGYVAVDGNYRLQNVDLGRLSTVEQTLHIGDNMLLGALDLPALHSVGPLNISGGDFNTLTLPRLSIAFNIHIQTTANLTSVTLPALQTLNRTLRFSNNTRLASVHMPILKNVTTVVADGNPKLCLTPGDFGADTDTVCVLEGNNRTCDLVMVQSNMCQGRAMGIGEGSDGFNIG